MSMVIFNSYVSHYQRVYPINIPLNHYKIPLNHHKPEGNRKFNAKFQAPASRKTKFLLIAHIIRKGDHLSS